MAPISRLLLAAGALLASACGGGSVNVWPFTAGGPAEISRAVTDAVEYRCDANRRFFVRRLEGNAVWLIAPDRELRLAPAGGEGRYAAGKVVLQLDGQNATLLDPPAEFANCRIPAPAAEKK